MFLLILWLRLPMPSGLIMVFGLMRSLTTIMNRLNGDPTRFAFDLAQPGNIINAADLSVPGNLALVGGSVINTGSLRGSNIAIAAVRGDRSIRITYPGNLVSIEVEPPRDSQGNPQPINPLDLPKLLTEGGSSLNTGLSVVNGQVQITDTNNSFPQRAEHSPPQATYSPDKAVSLSITPEFATPSRFEQRK